MTFTYLRYRPTLLCAAILALLFACQSDNGTNTSNQIATSDNDSISIWITKGKSSELAIDERRNYLNKALTAVGIITPDSLKAHKLSQISLGFKRINDSLKFMELNAMAISVAKINSDSIALGNAYWDRGSFFEAGSIMDSAFVNYNRAYNVYKGKGETKFAAQMLRNMGVIQNNIGDFFGGEQNIIGAIALFKEIDDYKNLYKSYNSLGITAGNLNNYNEALNSYDQALEYLKKTKENESFRINLLNNIGIIYLDSEEYFKSQDYFEQVILNPSSQELNPSTYARALTNLGIAKMYQSANPTKPLEFEQALLIQDSIEDIQGLSKTLYALADYYRIIGDLERAKERALQALDFARRSNNNERELAALKLLTSVDKDSSSYHSIAHFRLHDSLDLAERKMQNKFARIRFETDEVLAKNETLTRQRTLWLGAAVGFLLLALSIYIIAAQRTRNQKLKFLQEQQETNQEIFNLMMKQNLRLEEGKQLEQKRISEELHDGILGQMNGVRMVLLGLNGKEDPDSIKLRGEAIEKLQAIQEEIRNISHALSDASIQKVNNFLTSVIELLKATSESSGIAYTLDYDKDFDWDNLTGEIKINLYRILQECLQNCVKHAHASEVNVEFSIANDEIQTTIKDNGRGFDVEKQKSGIGHKNIDSRVSKLGGSWYVDSRKGKGSLVIVFIPYKGMRSPLTLSRSTSRKPQNKKLVG